MRDQESIVSREVVPHADHTRARASLPGASPRGDRPVPTSVARESRVGVRDERVADIRQRVRDGAYDTRAVAEQVARRILESGDL